MVWENNKMIEQERQKAIDTLKEICQEIGCSGLEEKLCQEEPHKCSIIKKLLNGSKK